MPAMNRIIRQHVSLPITPVVDSAANVTNPFVESVPADNDATRTYQRRYLWTGAVPRGSLRLWQPYGSEAYGYLPVAQFPKGFLANRPSPQEYINAINSDVMLNNNVQTFVYKDKDLDGKLSGGFFSAMNAQQLSSVDLYMRVYQWSNASTLRAWYDFFRIKSGGSFNDFDKNIAEAWTSDATLLGPNGIYQKYRQRLISRGLSASSAISEQGFRNTYWPYLKTRFFDLKFKQRTLPYSLPTPTLQRGQRNRGFQVPEGTFKGIGLTMIGSYGIDGDWHFSDFWRLRSPSSSGVSGDQWSTKVSDLSVNTFLNNVSFDGIFAEYASGLMHLSSKPFPALGVIEPPEPYQDWCEIVSDSTAIGLIVLGDTDEQPTRNITVRMRENQYIQPGQQYIIDGYNELFTVQLINMQGRFMELSLSA